RRAGRQPDPEPCPGRYPVAGQPLRPTDLRTDRSRFLRGAPTTGVRMSTTCQELLIAGTCDPGFEGVRAEVEGNFRSRIEIGASVCVQVRGRTVVDLWGGIAEPQSGRAWDRDTVGVIFCTTKSAAAACVHLLAGRGQLDLHRPVAAYWPEFGSNG